jgi:glycosyltransferase involved in cell wall biosynthesis
MKISIITPCYNEQENILECYEAIYALFEGDLRGYTREHIFIDNCSNDASESILREIAGADSAVKVIFNARNFGPHRSPLHGIFSATGDCVIPVVCDLQTPISLIPEFVDHWERGFKIVFGIRVSMGESTLVQFLRKAYYRAMEFLAGYPHINGFIGFGLFDRSVIEQMRRRASGFPYFRALVFEVAGASASIPYVQPTRRRGVSKQRVIDLIDFSINGVVTSGRIPIRLMTLIGVVAAIVSFLTSVGYLVAKLIWWDSFSAGIAPIISGVFFFCGLQLVFIGLIGEYIGVLTEKVSNPPLVIERSRVNF